MSSEIITSNDLKKILASAFPARANTTITSITLPYTPPCNGLFIGMLRAAGQGRAYKQYSNTEPNLWDFYQVAGGYSTFASFVQAGKEIAQTATANISDAPYYFFVPLDGTSPLFGGSADAIVEQGTSGIWTYRKWSSGISECWGTWSGNLTHYAQVFGGYAFYTGNISYPTGFFLEKPNAQYTGAIGSGFCLTGTILANSTKDYITCYGVGTASGTQACTFYIYAKGNWK